MQYEAMRRKLTTDFPQGGLCQAIFEGKDEAAAALVLRAFSRMKVEAKEDGQNRVRAVFEGADFGKVATAVASLNPTIVKYVGPATAEPVTPA